MKIYYTIYLITNIVNDKIYIGAHKTNDLDDSYFGSGKALKLAIKKYGKDNFIKEYLWFCSSEKEMYALEKKLVNEEFIKRNDVYNLTVGGFHYKKSPNIELKRRKNISKSMKLLWCNEEYKTTHPFNKITKEQRSINAKNGWNNWYKTNIKKKKKSRETNNYRIVYITKNNVIKEIRQNQLTAYKKCNWKLVE